MERRAAVPTADPLEKGIRAVLILGLVLTVSASLLKNRSVVSVPGSSLTEAPPMPSPLDFRPFLPAKYASFLEVDSGCIDPSGSRDSTGLPAVDINAVVPATPGKISWLIVTQDGTRNYRVLKGSEKGKNLIFSKRYYGSADPDGKYTDYPVGKFNFKKGKKYRVEVNIGDLSSRRTPLWDNKPPVLKDEFWVPFCRGNR